MATAQCTRQRDRTGTWSSIFPNEITTCQQSLIFVKRLVAVAVSSITYLRAIFPEYAFGDRCLDDLNLKILKDDSSCEGACQVIKWIKGCFDALEKKYLRMLIIAIYSDPEEPENAIESYTFKFSYSDIGGVDIYRNDSHVISVHTTAETKKETIRLLRTIIILTQSLHSLPDEAYLTMKLLYYDEVTPLDYEPPGFQPAANEGFNFDFDPLNIKVGDIMTPFHSVKLRIKTDSKQFETDEMPAEMCESEISSGRQADEGLDTGNHPQQTSKKQTSLDMSSGHTTSPTVSQVSDKNGGLQVVPEPTEADNVPPTPANQPDENMTAAGTRNLKDSVSPTSPDNYGVRCGCGCNEDDGLMILCAHCKTWQHGICYKIINEEDAPEIHICERCADPQNPNLQPTDPDLQSLKEIAREATCLWRRALFVCQETSRIIVPNLARRLGVETTVAHGLMSRLEREGYMKQAKNKRQGKVVDQQMLEIGLRKYLGISKKDGNNTLKSESKTDGSKRVSDKEVEKITSKAENISLTGRNKQQNTLPRATDTAAPAGTNSRKRARPLSNMESGGFEVTSSQDVSQSDHPKQQAKRRKSSVARKCLRV